MAKARRKPGPRWQSRDTGGGFPPKSSRESSRASETVHETFGSTCRWKAFWIEQAVPFDEGAGEAVLGASRRVRSKRPGRARGATESVRGRSPTSHAADNAAVRWPPPSSESPPHPPTAQSGGRATRAVVEWTEAGDRAVKRALPGAGSPFSFRGEEAGWRRSRPHASARKGWGKRMAAVGEAQASALGNQAIHGCSCRESVAEVGEEHLPRATKGSREANRGHAR